MSLFRENNHFVADCTVGCSLELICTPSTSRTNSMPHHPQTITCLERTLPQGLLLKMVMRERPCGLSLAGLLVEALVERYPSAAAGSVGTVTRALRRRRPRPCPPPGGATCDDVRAKSTLLGLRFFYLLSPLPLSVGIERLPVSGELLSVGTRGREKLINSFETTTWEERGERRVYKDIESGDGDRAVARTEYLPEVRAIESLFAWCDRDHEELISFM